MFIFYLLLIISITAAENPSIIYIHEELPSNILLYSSISSSNTLQWLPSSYSFQSYFFLTPNQSLYTANQSIDREEFCEKKLCNCSQCLINLNFLQTFSTNNISIRTIQIIIEDINDHSPTFKQSMIKLPIAENVPIDYEIPLESAIDSDYGLLSIQTYELYPIINNPFRLLKSSKPILKLHQNLDREMKSSYLLKLIAYDGGQPALSGEQIIEIIITDVNDNAPIFDQFIYRKSLPENQPIDSLIIKIHALDPDEGENARINYSIDDPSSTFNINHQTGEIFLRKSLDYEKIRSYSITIKAHDNGVPQLNNYATLIIDVTDVNDHTPNVLLTQVNGTLMNNRLINLPECSITGIPLLYIYITDEDSGDNGRVSCTLNDTRLTLIYLTTNAYSLQISGLPSFDYEFEQSVVIHLQCRDYGLVSLSTSTLVYIQIEDCNDNPPEIIYPLLLNQSLLIPYETTVTPFVITQFIVDDRDRFQANRFSYSFIVSPYLDLSLTDNGTLILHSMPFTIGNGRYRINVTVADSGNLTSEISLPIYIHSINETRNFSIENTSLTLCLIFFTLIFLSAIFISICYLITFILRRNLQQSNSSSQSTTSSNEQAGSSQKTTIEVLDENSSNRIEVKQVGVINTSGIHQSDFDYSEKVQRYLTHLNNHHRYEIDEEDRFRRLEQLYAIIERQTNLDVSSNSLYV